MVIAKCPLLLLPSPSPIGMLVALQNESFRSLSTNLCILELSLKEFSRERYDFFPGLEKQVEQYGQVIVISPLKRYCTSLHIFT